MAGPAHRETILLVDGENIDATLGGSLQWVTDNKVRAFDLGVELFGPTTNFSIGYRHDF